MHKLITKYPVVSDQITPKELSVVLTYAERSRVVDGDFTEFGCYVGTSSMFLSRLLTDSDKKLWVYDSFDGLPEKSPQDSSPAGFAFKEGELSASKKQFISNYKKANLPLPIITKSWFKNLRPNQLPNMIAFAFLDGDYYESILITLGLTAPLLADGGYVLVHDYGRITLPGPKRAVENFLNTNSSLKLIGAQEHIAILAKP